MTSSSNRTSAPPGKGFARKCLMPRRRTSARMPGLTSPVMTTAGAETPRPRKQNRPGPVLTSSAGSDPRPCSRPNPGYGLPVPLPRSRRPALRSRTPAACVRVPGAGPHRLRRESRPDRTGRRRRDHLQGGCPSADRARGPLCAHRACGQTTPPFGARGDGADCLVCRPLRKPGSDGWSRGASFRRSARAIAPQSSRVRPRWPRPS